MIRYSVVATLSLKSWRYSGVVPVARPVQVAQSVIVSKQSCGDWTSDLEPLEGVYPQTPLSRPVMKM